MRLKKLKKVKESVSEMALGTMYFNTLVDAETSICLMDKYTGMGGNFIDTANMYACWLTGFNGGESESLIGQWFAARGNRNQIFLSTKVGLPMRGVEQGLSKDLIILQCDKSLRRLKTDRIDLYFAHRQDEKTPLDQTLEAFDLLKKQGKIRYMGISNHRSYLLARLKEISRFKGLIDVDFAQYRHTYLRTKPGTLIYNPKDARMCLTEDLADLIKDSQINFMGYQILLSGAYCPGKAEIPRQYLSKDSTKRLETLHLIAEESGASVNQVVLSWAMKNQPSTIPIITGSSIEQIEENVKACQITLSQEQIQRLNRAGE